MVFLFIYLFFNGVKDTVLFLQLEFPVRFLLDLVLVQINEEEIKEKP